MKGFTLVELIVCIALTGIVTGLAVPAIRDIEQRSQAALAINWLLTAVLFTRGAAITYNTNVTLCPSTDGHVCGGRWQQGTIVFTDHNFDHRIDGKDRLLRRITSPLSGAKITWHSFGNRQYLQITGDGYTHYQNGNFVYCPQNGDLHYARQLVVNISGRARTSKDVNHDGFVEDRYGHHLVC